MVSRVSRQGATRSKAADLVVLPSAGQSAEQWSMTADISACMPTLPATGSTLPPWRFVPGAEKAKFHWLKFALLAIGAGCYCGFGFTLCLLVSSETADFDIVLLALLFGINHSYSTYPAAHGRVVAVSCKHCVTPA